MGIGVRRGEIAERELKPFVGVTVMRRAERMNNFPKAPFLDTGSKRRGRGGRDCRTRQSLQLM